MEWFRKNSTTENTIVEQEHRISPELTVPLLHIPFKSWKMVAIIRLNV